MTNVVDALKAVLGDTYVLYVKTHSYHWNVQGPNFQSLHAMFMEQYTQMWQSLDDLAERIRALGAMAPGSSSDIITYASIKEGDNSVPTANAMLQNLIADHETWLKTANDAIGVAGDVNDVATEDLLTQLIAAHDKAKWMLTSSLEQ